MKVNVIGYYVDAGVKQNDAKKEDVFLVYENEHKTKGKFLEGYAPVGQHFELKDERYLGECTKIDKETYKRISKGIYTPKEYL